ncbi:MAG: NAD-dependent epimerase/dehydratase family protein [Phycisphaerales bacterium]
MSTTRRGFLTSTAMLGAAVAMSKSESLAAAAGARPGLKVSRANGAAGLSILILGGTGFLGPATIDAAKARGHTVTIFNRGRREKYVGARDGVEKLYGNRDPEKHAQTKFVDGKEVEDESSPKGLEELVGRKFDAVIDNSGYVPRIVKASAELLAPNVGQYIFISSVSVYKSNERANMDESDEVGTIEDPTVEEMGAQFQNYGPLKALCEQAAERAMPGRTTAIRPGFIVGVGDTTDRFTYWPVRTSRGGEVLVPGAPEDPVQFIDVRDLSEFIITCVEKKVFGTMNATGPRKPMRVGDLMDACISASKKTGAKGDAHMNFVPYDWLAGHGLEPGTLAILLPSTGETAGFHTRVVEKAVKAGLTFRPAEETCQSLIEWWPKAVALRAKVAKETAEEAAKAGRPAPRTPPADQLRTGITPEREAELLKEFAGRTK